MGWDEFRGARFVNRDMSGAEFRDVLLRGARMRGVVLDDTDIDGAIDGLRINGVEVAPLVEAELDRRHPERVALRPTTITGAREAWAVVESFWAATTERALALPEADLHRSVDDEWSLVQTLRHLVFVTDAWFFHAALGQPHPYHPAGVVPDFVPEIAALGIDPAAAPSAREVLALRADRFRRVREFLDGADQDDLDRVREPNPVPGYPPSAPRSALQCLRVVLSEEWEHHRFAVRDLDRITARG
ncbi:DinB family protein [Pseudonocardia humida]|uniref:DinB family protein n=1 Tax=Pseudonocardia humida TaxID=2800819 RepID=A0ABT0ZXF8_9PSEU|nr:DinB family protein [Pseudonocardia humida]MCO1655355.1 DinB family protein [Pseudonocardia humida]